MYLSERLFKYNKILVFLLFLFLITIPFSFANDVDENVTLSQDLQNNGDNIVSSGSNVYFDASAQSDGSGSQSSPYKYLNSGRLSGYSNYYFAPGIYTINSKPYSSGFLSSEMNIIGSNPKTTVIYYTGSGNFLETSSTLVLKNITLKGANIKVQNGMIANNTIFEGSISNIEDNYGNSYGGAIKIVGSSSSSFYDELWNIFNQSSSSFQIRFDNCIFKNNYAEYGGAIYINCSSVVISNSKFINNHAKQFGGGIAAINKSNLTIINSVFEDSYSEYDAGGAIYLMNSKSDIKYSNLTNCKSSFGPAITSLNSSVVIDKINANKNNASYQGGSIYAMYGNLTVKDSNFNENFAKYGGAIFADNLTKFEVLNSKFNNNKAFYQAGAIFAFVNLKNSIDNCTYIGNKADENDDIYQSDLFEIFIGNENYEMIKYKSDYKGVLPSKYDLRDKNHVSSVKEQGNSGNCWAFATIATLESTIMKATGKEFDLSEGNLKNIAQIFSDYGWPYETNNGGLYSFSLGYLLSWLGPVNETSDPSDEWDVISPVLNSVVHVQNILFLERKSYNDNDMIKKAIMEYGAVASEICMKFSTQYMNQASYYYNGNESRNHAITIIGWDDNYSKSNFRLTPPGNGAWIVKNSYGKRWGDSGFGYVSYYDKSLAKLNDHENTFAIIFNDTIRFNKNYQYDICGKTDYFVTGYNTIYYQNQFTSTGNDVLAAFSTYFNTTTEWEADIIVNDVVKLSQNATSLAGYHTIHLKELIPLKLGDVFKISLKIHNNNGFASFPICEKVSSSRCFYTQGVSFFSYDGKNWHDLYDYFVNESYGHKYSSQVACIKAFTTASKDILNTTIAITSLNSTNILVSIKDQNNKAVNMGIVNFNVDGKDYTEKVINGVANLKVYLKSGNHNILAIYKSNDYYNTSSIFKMLTLDKEDLFLEIISNNISYGDDLKIAIKLTNIIGENLILPVNVEVAGKKHVTNGELLKISDLKPGNYTIKAKFMGNNLYNQKTLNKIVNVASPDLNLRIFTQDINVGDDLTVKAILGNLSNAIVNIKINNKSYILNIKNGKGSLNISNKFKAGEYGIFGEFKGDGIYSASKTSSKFKVNKINTSLIVECENIVEGENLIINVKIPSDINGKISLMLNSKVYNSIADKGIVKFNISGLGVGNYLFNVKYDGDDKYNKVSNSSFVNISKSNSKLILVADNIYKYYGGFEKFSALLLDNNSNPISNQKINVFINKVKYSKLTDKNGLVEIDISSLAVGSYNVLSVFDGDKKYNVNKVYSKINVTSTIKASDFQARFLDSEGNTLANTVVSFIINKKEYLTVTDINGIAKFDIKLSVGAYEVKIINPLTNENLTRNVKIFKRITLNRDLTMDYNSGNTFNVRIYGDNGKISHGGEVISFKIGKNTFNVKTDKNGYAKLKINLIPNKYKIITSYKGERVFNNIVVNPVLKAKNIVVKKSKTIKFSATLKNTNKKAIIGKKITFKVKGKIYTAKTNKKGIATIYLKNFKVGKYNICSKYVKSSVKNSIIVKK